MDSHREERIGGFSGASGEGYTGFFICFFDEAVNPHSIDFKKFEEGYDLIGEIEKVFLSGNPYCIDNNEYYFFQDAWPLTTHFIAPVSLSELMDDPYFAYKFQSIQTSNVSFDVEEGVLEQSDFKRVFIEKECGLAHADDSKGSVMRHRSLQNVVDIFEECGRRAVENNGFLVANINRSNKSTYLGAMEMQRRLSSLLSLRDGESPLKDLEKHGYVFVEYYLK